jgi:hypothetical protein
MEENDSWLLTYRYTQEGQQIEALCKVYEEMRKERSLNGND